MAPKFSANEAFLTRITDNCAPFNDCQELFLRQLIFPRRALVSHNIDSQMAEPGIESSSIPKVKPLEGTADYPHRRKNARAYVTHYDPLLLGLKPDLQGNSAQARAAWKKTNALPKSNIIILLSESVPVRDIAYCDYPAKSAHDL